MQTERGKFGLESPEEARTMCHAALLWEKVEGAQLYRIYVDGKETAVTDKTDYTLRELESGHSYDIYVEASAGLDTVVSSHVTIKTRDKSVLLDVTDFGAVGDGRTLNTQAVQAAIDGCPPGGTVMIPAGIFLTGALFLKSDMTLYMEEGSKLLGSSRLEDFPLITCRFEGREQVCYASLLNTGEEEEKDFHSITIAGKGTIDANGMLLRKLELAEGKGKPGRTICLRRTDGVYLEGITVRQSPAWCVHLVYCNHVSLNGVHIHTKYDEKGNRYEGIANGDGLDPDSCSYVKVFNCTIASQDDCIAIKAGRNEEGRRVGIPSEHIRISNCTFLSGFGVAVGSEMSGGVRDVLVQDCTFRDTYSICSIKAPRGRGGIVENITYDSMKHCNHSREHQDCKWFRGAIYIDQFYSHDEYDWENPQPVDEGTSHIRNITLKNMEAETVTGNAVFLAGLPESPLENIRLVNVKAGGRYGMKAANIRNLQMENVTIGAREGGAYEYHAVSGKKEGGEIGSNE